MPTVKAYERQVEAKPLPGVRREKYPIPHLQTPAPAVAKTGMAEGVAQFASAASAEATDLWARELEKQNQVKVLSAKNQLESSYNQLFFDDQTGALNVHGEAALGLSGQVPQTLNDTIGKIRTGLANDRQRLEFDGYADGVKNDAQRTLMQHVSRERVQLEDQHMEAYKDNRTQAALADPDPMGAEQAAVDISAEYQKYGDRRHQDPDVTKAAIGKARSDIFAGMIDRYLDNNEDIKASVYYGEHKQDILGSEQGKIEKSLQRSSTLGDAQRIVDTIKPKYSEDMSQTDLEDEIPKLTQNPEVRQQAEQLLGRWFQQKRADTRFTQEQASKLAKQQLDDFERNIKNNLDRADRAKSYEQIVPQSVRDQLPESVERAQRAYWKDIISEDKEPKTDPTVWGKLRLEAANDPDTFVKENIDAYVHKLDRGDYKELVSLKAGIIKGDDKDANKTLQGIRTHTQVIEKNLRDIGIDPSDKANAAAKAQLWKAVDDEVIFREGITKKPVGPEEFQKIVDDLTSITGAQKGSWMGLLPGGGPFFDVPGKPRFELPVKGIKPGEFTQTNPKTGEVQVWRGGQWVNP